MNQCYCEISLSARRDSDAVCVAEIGGFFCCSSFLTRKKNANISICLGMLHMKIQQNVVVSEKKGLI